MQSGCPPTYVCKMDSLTGKNLCCGSTDLGKCLRRCATLILCHASHLQGFAPQENGHTSKLFPKPHENVNQECQGLVRVTSCVERTKERIGTFAVLPTPKVRHGFRPVLWFYISSSFAALCPNGKAAYRDPVTNQPQTCYINTASKTCPSGYECQSSLGGVSQGFCCSLSGEDSERHTRPHDGNSCLGVCPKNSEFYAESSGKPRQCVFSSSTEQTQCPTGYGCKAASGASGSSGYCCKLPAPPASGDGARPRELLQSAKSWDLFQPSAQLEKRCSKNIRLGHAQLANRVQMAPYVPPTLQTGNRIAASSRTPKIVLNQQRKLEVTFERVKSSCLMCLY